MVTNVIYPQKAYINALTIGKNTIATFTSEHDFTIGQIVCFHVSKDFGTYEINNKKGKVLSLESDSITVDIESTGWTPFDYSALNNFGTTPPHCVPSGSGKIPNSEPATINIVDAFDNRRST